MILDVLLSIHERDLDSLITDPPNAAAGPIETQQLISSVKVLNVLPVAGGQPGFAYTLAMPLQDALMLKYVKDTVGTLDLVLILAANVKRPAIPSPGRPMPWCLNTVTPIATAKATVSVTVTPVPGIVGTPRPKGVLNVFVTPILTPTPRSTSTAVR